MIVWDAAAFRRAWAQSPPVVNAAACARGFMLIEPTGFRLSGETAQDNAYMDLARTVDVERARAQHATLAQAIAAHTGLPVQVFPGDPATPDAVFPNNAFACANGRLLLGAMRHPERQRETERQDIVDWFAQAHGYAAYRVQGDGVVAELTGPLIVDRARGVGYHGMTERLTRAGVAALDAAFDLRLSFAFELAPGEYHTNVVMSVLAGRALVIHAPSFADTNVPRAIAERYAPHVLWLTDAQKQAFAGNCLALTDDTVWMSARAERALTQDHRETLRRAGFVIHTVDIDEIEKAGGSLRCCVMEIF
jgi:hypothetical protein